MDETERQAMNYREMTDAQLLEYLSLGTWGSSELLALNRELVDRYKRVALERDRLKRSMETLASCGSTLHERHERE